MYYTKNTMKNKLFRGFGILLILCLIGIAGGSFYMLSYSLTPDKGQNDEDRSYQKMVADYPFLEKWVDSLRGISALRDTFIVNREGYGCMLIISLRGLRPPVRQLLCTGIQIMLSGCS